MLNPEISSVGCKQGLLNFKYLWVAWEILCQIHGSITEKQQQLDNHVKEITKLQVQLENHRVTSDRKAKDLERRVSVLKCTLESNTKLEANIASQKEEISRLANENVQHKEQVSKYEAMMPNVMLQT